MGKPTPSDAAILAHLQESGSIEGTAFALDVHPAVVRQLKLQTELRRVDTWGPRGDPRFADGVRLGLRSSAR